MQNSKKLVFFGTDDFSSPALKRLLKDGWRVDLVVTKPDSPAGRGRRVIKPQVKLIAERMGISILQPRKVSEINSDIAGLKPDAGVLAAYGRIIPSSTIDLFPLGIVNIHPSLLPKYRGPSPIESSILAGDKKTGISLMQLSAGMDEGPVYKQMDVALSGTETQPELYEKLADLGAEFLAEQLPDIFSGKLLPEPQDDEKASYTKLLQKEDGILDFSQPAEILEHQVRAFARWPRTTTRVYGQKIIVTKARVAKDDSDGALVMRCHPGWLEIQELVAPSGRKMSGVDFMRGYKK